MEKSIVLNTFPGVRFARWDEALWRWNLCWTDNLLRDLRSKVKRLAIGRAPEVSMAFLFTRTILKLWGLLIGEERFSGELWWSLGGLWFGDIFGRA